MARKAGLAVTVMVSAALLGAIGGCKNDSVKATNESAASVAKKVAESDIKPRAGRWEGSVKINEMNVPGMPAEVKAALDERLAKPQTFTTCLTAEQAAKPDASFFQQSAEGCTYDHFSMASGKIDAKVTCTRGGQKKSILMNGSYSPESYAITVDSNGEVKPGTTATMKMAIDAKRAGDCTGKEG